MGEEKTEGQILFPEIEVGGFKVKPWTLKQFFSLLPVFLKAAEILKEKQVSIEEFEGFTNKPEQLRRILSVLEDVSSVVPEIVSKTIGHPVEEIECMEFDRVISIVLVIVIQNVERIKNFSGLARSAIGSLTIETTV